MGAIVQKTQLSPLSFCSAQTPLSLLQFSHTALLSNGLTLVRTQEGEPALYYSKSILEPAHRPQIQKWMQATYHHSCNIRKYHYKTLSMLCSTHINFNILLEYGQQNLAEMLGENPINTVLDKSHTASSDRALNTSVQILQFIRFLIEAIQEQLKINGEWVTFHSSNLVYFKKDRRFKYLHLPSFDGVHERQIYFDPYSPEDIKPSQSASVFSIGMVLMSLLLREDCSDCYNFQNFSFCWSIFEERKERIEEQMLEKGSNDLSRSGIGTSLDEDILTLTMAAISQNERASFAEIKGQYYKLLRKITKNSNLGFGETMQKERKQNTKLPQQQMLNWRSTMDSADALQQNNRENIDSLNFSDESPIPHKILRMAPKVNGKRDSQIRGGKEIKISEYFNYSNKRKQGERANTFY